MKTTDKVAPVDLETVRDHVEAAVRRRMATVTPTTQVRGFDGQRQRAQELSDIDQLLDQWLDLAPIEAR